MNYWKLITYDNEEIKVKPENVEFVQNKLDTKEGFIRTPDRSINVKTIKDFVETSELFTDQKLLENASTAFHEPIYNKDGSLICKYVKKTVSLREWTKYYMFHPAYRRLDSSDNHIVITWRQPIHLINKETMFELTPNEEMNLSKAF